MLKKAEAKYIIDTSSKRFYVYGLYEPKESTPFYIGKGSGYRVFEHLKLRCGNKVKKDTIKKCNKNLRYRLYFFTDMESLAYRVESRLIHKYMGTLTNIHKPIYADKKSITKKIFLSRVSDLHPSLDYSETVYKGWDVPILVNCREHGQFKTTCRNHLKSENPTGCPKCGDISGGKKNSEKGRKKFEDFKKSNTNLYSFKFFKYVNARTPSLIYCKKEGHGFFKKSADSIMNGEVCPKCSKTIADTIDTFIDKAIAKHGSIYDYSGVVYLNNKTKVEVKCSEHGLFEVTPDNHLSKGSGCPECAKVKRGLSNRLNTEEFIRRSKEVHKDFYDYSKSVYTTRNSLIKIICPIHGEFEQKADNHMVGKGCKHWRDNQHNMLRLQKSI